MTFRPMLADTAHDLSKLKFPLMVSPKLDGVRAIVIDGVLMSRSLKPIPNAYAQKLFSKLPDGTDGELIVGNATEDPYRKTVSAVMSEDGENPELRFWIFDNYLYTGGFQVRYEKLNEMRIPLRSLIVPHTLVRNIEELQHAEQSMVEGGYEGAMIRSIDGPYKFGRATEKQGYLLKVKRFVDMNAEIIGTYEWQQNLNEAKTNALGRTERSSHQENKVGAGVLGGFHVKGLESPYEGVEFSVGTGFQGADDPNGERGKLWKIRKSLVGKIVKVKFFPTGSLDKPRFPTFIGFRDREDM